MPRPYLAAVVSVIAMAGVRQLLDPLLGRDAPMLLFVFAVVIASLRHGTAAGVVATILSLPVGAYLFIEPRYTFAPTRPEDIVRLVLFTIEGLAIAYAAGSMQRHSRELEAEVERRTHDLRAQANELQASNEALETFAHTISHDIRAPLRSIRTFGEILQEDFGTQLPDVARDYTARIAMAAQRLEELVNNLLAYTRLGRRAVPPEPVSLDRVVAAAVSHLEAEIRHAQASITIASQPLGAVVGTATSSS